MSEFKLVPKWHHEAGFILEVEGLKRNEHAGDKMRQIADDCNNTRDVVAELARTKEMLAVAEAGLKEVAAPISFGCYTERYRKARFYAKQALAKINKMKEV